MEKAGENFWQDKYENMVPENWLSIIKSLITPSYDMSLSYLHATHATQI